MILNLTYFETMLNKFHNFSFPGSDLLQRFWMCVDGNEEAFEYIQNALFEYAK